MRDLFSPYMYVRMYVRHAVNQQRFRNAKGIAKTFSTYFVHLVYASIMHIIS